MFNYRYLLVVILVVSIFGRFVNFEDRWTLQQDQARDAIIALYSLETRQLPLLGPPSSAGSFSFGPLYYWLVILFTIILPVTSGPWLGFALLSVLAVIVFFLVGKNLLGTGLAVILGLLMAISPKEVFNAADLLNPIPISFFTITAFYSLIKLVEQKKLIYSLILGLAVGTAINLHLQALGLIFLLPLVLIFNHFNPRQKLLTAAGIVLGLFVSFIPLLYFDLKHQGVWIQSVAAYLLSGQNKFNIIYSWRGDIFNFWPKLWGEVVLGIPTLGYFLIIIFLGALFFSGRKKINLSKSWWIIFLSFISQILILHFYKGPRLPVYLIVYQPYLIFLTGWALFLIWRINHLLGTILCVTILLISSYSSWQIINQKSQAPMILEVKTQIESKLKPPYQIYTYPESNTSSLPLYYLFKKEGKLSNSGQKLAICVHNIERTADLTGYTENCPEENNLIIENQDTRIFGLDQTGSQNPKLVQITDQLIYSWLSKNY